MQEFILSIGESIHIGKDVQVKVITKGARLGVSLGIKAPRDVAILRGELAKVEEKKREPVITFRKRRRVKNTV